ncbi:MAG: transposase [Gammaproteobacteria bacterium]|nr:transposase [Gammaproteobacteria bacterium]MCW5584352.1 transposase [Gammaproteobacteria bacterium]
MFSTGIWVFDQQVYLAGSRSERGELMIVATNRSPKNAIAVYLRRWEIESPFASLKSKGFRFEETHMTQLDRIEKLADFRECLAVLNPKINYREPIL